MSATAFNMPKNVNLDLAELKAFADEQLKVDQIVKLALDKAENIVEKGDNADYLHPKFQEAADNN